MAISNPYRNLHLSIYQSVKESKLSNIIKVYCVGSSGKMIDLSYSADYYTVETASISANNHGFTVIYTTTIS